MNPTAVAKACLAAATALQQLAAALEERPPLIGHVPGVWKADGTPADPPASVAEPECGCSLYSRCDTHEATRSKVCTCNGPYASSSCRIPTHLENAMRAPHRDPSLVG